MKVKQSVKRTYGQWCGVARALDVLGERWTLLVIRELIIGPQRYKDLLDALPGIGTNLLAARLRDLERDGLVVRRKLPPPAASAVYELAALGRELEPIVIALGRWGRKLLPPTPEEEVFQGRYLLFALRANFAPERARGVSETYELRVGTDVVHARVDDGALEVAAGPAEKADLVVETSLETLLAIARGDADLREEIRAERVFLHRGGPTALRRFWSIFDGAGLPATGTAAA